MAPDEPAPTETAPTHMIRRLGPLVVTDAPFMASVVPYWRADTPLLTSTAPYPETTMQDAIQKLLLDRLATKSPDSEPVAIRVATRVFDGMTESSALEGSSTKPVGQVIVAVPEYHSTASTYRSPATAPAGTATVGAALEA